VSPYWYLFTAFVGLNLFQSGLTNWCPAMFILKELGLREARNGRILLGKITARGKGADKVQACADMSVRATQSAGELVAGEFQPAEIAEDGDGDAVGAEKFVGSLLQIFGGDGFDAFD